MSNPLSKIERLKRKAKSHYVSYMLIWDTLSCGKELLEVISPNCYRHKVEFNKAMDELCKLDPLAPTDRL